MRYSHICKCGHVKSNHANSRCYHAFPKCDCIGFRFSHFEDYKGNKIKHLIGDLK